MPQLLLGRSSVPGEVLSAAGELVAFPKATCMLADTRPALPEYVFAWTERYVIQGRPMTEDREIAVFATNLQTALRALGFPSRGPSLGPCGHLFPLIRAWLREEPRADLTVFIRGGPRAVLEEVAPTAFRERTELAPN